MLKKILKNLFTNKEKIFLQNKYPQYKIGKGSYGGLKVISWKDNIDVTLEMGAYCSIANGVKVFLGGEHRLDWVTTYPFNVLWESARHVKGHPKSKGNVVIGNDVWIGTDAIIMSGVTIGDGAVIGARSLVTRNVSPYAIVAGNPAKEIRKRFNDTIIQELLQIRWWEWSDERITRTLEYLLSEDIESFIRAVKEKII